MPACTPAGRPSSSRVTARSGRSSPTAPPQPAAPSASTSSAPRRIRWVRRRVTYSRNVTLSLSRTCRCYCKYCAFATRQAHLHDPAEVERQLDDAARRGTKELLVLTGEMPEVNPDVARRLADLGHEDFTS